MTSIHGTRKPASLSAANGREDDNSGAEAGMDGVLQGAVIGQGGEVGGSAVLIPSAKKSRGETVAAPHVARPGVLQKHKRSLKRL